MSKRIYDYDWLDDQGRRMHGDSAPAVLNTFNYRVGRGLKRYEDDFGFLFIFPIEGRDDEE